MNIEKTLQDRFGIPLADNYTRRIIFWSDPEREFEEIFDSLELEGVKLLKLTGNNNFYAKYLLLKEDTTSNYLIYNPIAYKHVEDNWLYDIELYSEEFRADLVSIRMQELNVLPSPELREVIKSYNKFFDNKERTAKFKSFSSSYSKVGQVHINVLSVLAGATVNTPAGIICKILSNGFVKEENESLENIKKFGNEEVLHSLIYKYTGYKESSEDSLSLISLATHIMITALSTILKVSHLKGLEKYVSEEHQQLCYSLVDEWLHSSDDSSLYEIARAVEEEHDLENRFSSLELSELTGIEFFPCINECIIKKFMGEISENVIKSEEIISTVEKRRTLKWHDHIKYYYDGLLQVASMNQFYLENSLGFHVADHNSLWRKYTDDYCKMDYYYRQFHSAFGKSLKESITGLEDLYKNVADFVENLYKNWYLSNLGTQWTNLIKEEVNDSSELTGLIQQKDFYKVYVKPIVSSGSRAYVIISDALRYEVGAELTDRLLKETKGTAKITSMQGIFPSITSAGMAALLPHSKIQLTNDTKFLCDGLFTDGTENREKILKKANEGNVAITYKALISMKQAERREAISGAQVVYIYHNAIDAVGDKSATEDEVFEACDQAIIELKNLVKLITNDLSGSNIIITSDHGFIYSYKPLEESDKGEKSFIEGTIHSFDKRYIIANSSCVSEHMLKIPLTHLESDYVGLTPLEYIRMKKQGGGSNYVHGGMALQEIVIPVIEFKNLRTTSKNYIDVKKAEIQLISQSRKISNSIFSLDFYQKEAVSGKTSSAVYEIHMSDSSGRQVSDKNTIIADKTTPNSQERVFRERFTLKSYEFKKTEIYYLTIIEKETAKIIEKIEFTIDIAFANDFDF